MSGPGLHDQPLHAQVLINRRAQSTAGWNIWTTLLDVTGGVLSIGQLVLDAVLTHDVGKVRVPYLPPLAVRIDRAHVVKLLIIITGVGFNVCCLYVTMLPTVSAPCGCVHLRMGASVSSHCGPIELSLLQVNKRNDQRRHPSPHHRQAV